MTRLRVALFHTSLPSPARKIGGVESAVHRLGNSLVKAGNVDVTVFSCDEAPPDAAYAHQCIFPRAAGSQAFRWFVLPFLLHFAGFRRFDVVHLHGDDWFWLWRRVPTVRTMHGSALREAQNATSRKRKLLRYMLFPLEILSARLATRTVAVGQDAKRIYRADALIGNSVDLARFRPLPKTVAPTLIFIGLWHGRKRGKMAFDVFVDEILPDFPEAILHMVADFSERHDSVVWHRWLDEAALATLLATSWVFIYPSSYEGFGIPYIEAMASGTAIVTTRNPGAVEVLEDGVYGIVVMESGFSAAVKSMLADPAMRTRFETAGLRRAQDFSEYSVASSYEAVYAAVR